MTENPYKTPSSTGSPRKTRSTRWLIQLGSTAIGLAMFCFALTIAGMIYSFQVVARSNTTPSPKDLANNIYMAAIPGYAVLPLGLIGIVLIIAGFLVRRPVD